MNSETSPGPAFSICVYCGSRPGADEAFSATAAQIGEWIGARGGQLVYGGGRSGLMGVVADATLAAGGRVVGVIPRTLVEREHAHRGCTELHIVETMHERKRIMAERADAFLALPGGIGTFEEFFETWTWRQLGYHDKPIGLLNQNGYYDAMLRFINHSVDSGFMDGSQMRLIETGTQWLALLEKLVEAAGFPTPDQLHVV
ncbi:TIGR00730 family Rossman fold protein [Ottowia testudinis]|uniref:Cytokinin riboside 5'-monophosphate phosphoribohydrolase n=1 Tax=Ottowia testudinis TaxID=2816950 RepID=A0A975CEI0_9BURK|nr:TIGR00730 family Rossman fold protein [Ottowia testudinis]QTD44064.1 TIGR00730 family Rossman fold protein [Ottowia testudinis]